MPTLEQLKERSATGRDLLALVRDFAIVFGLLVVLLYPPLLGTWLSHANIKSFAMGDFKVEVLQEAAAQTAVASDKVARLETTTRSALEQIEAAIKQNPATGLHLAPVRDTLQKSLAAAGTATREIASAAVTQRTALEQAAPKAAAQSGWVSTRFLQPQGGALVGQTVTVSGPLNLNIRSGPGTDAATLGIVPPGTKVRVLEGPMGNWVRITTEPTS